MLKSFFSTRKGKITVVAVALGIIALAAAVLLASCGGYRTTAVNDFNGITKVLSGKSTSDVFVGMHLKSGDDVTVGEQADLTLVLDNDKLVYAPEKTHFWLEVSGRKSDGRTKIHLDKGSVLCRVDTKLSESQSFEVETPNSTMSVRGTVFKVSVFEDENGDKYTVLDVFEGDVYAVAEREDGSTIDDSRDIGSGHAAIIRSDPSLSEFLDAEEIEDIEFPEGMELFISDIDGTGKNVTILSSKVFYTDMQNYEIMSMVKRLTEGEAQFLGMAIDDGRDIGIKKELLYDIAEVTPHEFIESEDEPGTLVCSVCGEVIKSNENSSEDTKTVSSDSKNINQKETVSPAVSKPTSKQQLPLTSEQAAKAKQVLAAQVTPTVAPTPTPLWTDPILDDDDDSDDGDDDSDDSNSCSHVYVETSRKYADCTHPDIVTEECSKCGDTRTREVGSPLGHNYSGSNWEYHYDPPGSYIAGYASRACSNQCGSEEECRSHTLSWKWEDGQIIAQGTYSHTAICSNCAMYFQQDCTPDTSHWEYDTDSHWRKCTVCGEKTRWMAHDYTTNQGKCAVCGYTP